MQQETLRTSARGQQIHAYKPRMQSSGAHWICIGGAASAQRALERQLRDMRSEVADMRAQLHQQGESARDAEQGSAQIVGALQEEVASLKRQQEEVTSRLLAFKSELSHSEMQAATEEAALQQTLREVAQQHEELEREHVV